MKGQEQMYHKLAVEIFMCACVCLIPLSGLVRSQEVNLRCECTVGEDDFAMHCYENQTCEWNWCRCNSEKRLCNDADSPCSEISCYCYKLYLDSSLWNCTVDSVGNLRCAECDETGADLPDLKNATVKRTLSPTYMRTVMQGFVPGPIYQAIRYGNHGTETKVRAQTSAHLLRRGVRCLQTLTESCLEDIEEEVCHVVKGPTTPPASLEKEDAMCDDSTWSIIGAFAGGFVLAILLTIVFLIFYIKRGAEPTSKATSSTSPQPAQRYNIMERIRTTFRRQNHLSHDIRYVVRTVDEPNSTSNQNGTTAASTMSSYAVQQPIQRGEALGDTLADRNNYTRIAPVTDDTRTEGTYEELDQINGPASGTTISSSADSPVAKQRVRNLKENAPTESRRAFSHDDRNVYSGEVVTDYGSPGVDNEGYFILQPP